MQSCSQCEQLLDVETVGGGVFRPDVADPEMSQACSTSLWELVLFRVCYQYIYMWGLHVICYQVHMHAVSQVSKLVITTIKLVTVLSLID